jgi:hypothetical protein
VSYFTTLSVMDILKDWMLEKIHNRSSIWDQRFTVYLDADGPRTNQTSQIICQQSRRKQHHILLRQFAFPKPVAHIFSGVELRKLSICPATVNPLFMLPIETQQLRESPLNKVIDPPHPFPANGSNGSRSV